jgi:hypothetical protein
MVHYPIRRKSLPALKDNLKSLEDNLKSLEDCFNRGPRVEFTTWDGLTDPATYIDGERPKFNIRKCTGSSCISTKDKLEDVIPSYEPKKLKDLRDWVLNFVSCWIAHWGVWRGEPAVQSAANFCGQFLLNSWWMSPNTDPSSLGIYELFHWVFTNLLTTNWESQQVWEEHLGRQDLMSMIMPEGRFDIPEGVCHYRFWNITTSTTHGPLEMVSLKSLLQQFKSNDRSLHRASHQNCTVQFCLQNDENTTEVLQHHLCVQHHLCDPKLHLCDPQHHLCDPQHRLCDPQLHLCLLGCKTIPFLIDNVNNVPDPKDGATAWSISSEQPELKRWSKNRPYMAISHVWSDGTGIGSKGAGNVNQCLVDHWKKIANDPKISCRTIWWDTISLPTDKDKRNEALNKMHSNYKKAKCTLVHDLELASFTWKDDGSPCLALAFSTWFSRGWTALELYVSETVWVLFKDSNGKPVLKNLDTEVLACPNDIFAHPAHKVLTDIILRLRPKHKCVCKNKGGCRLPSTHDQEPMSVVQLLNVMKLRYTCWPRDRLIIAGLMIGESMGSDWFKPTLSKTDITKNILTACGKLGQVALLHDQLPMCEDGPWSWCPPLIFNLNDSQFGLPRVQIGKRKLYGKRPDVQIKEGQLFGEWEVVTLLTENEKLKLKPYASHDVLAARITAALENFEKYCLLNPINRRLAAAEALYILAENLESVQEGRYDKYRFVGIVTWPCSGDEENYEVAFRTIVLL